MLFVFLSMLPWVGEVGHCRGTISPLVWDVCAVRAGVVRVLRRVLRMSGLWSWARRVPVPVDGPGGCPG